MVFVRRGNRADDMGFTDLPHPLPVGRFRNITISGIRGSAWQQPIVVAGIPGYPVENVVLKDIEITYPGGGTEAQAQRTDIPECERDYPENIMFGVLPAYGAFVRHAKNIVFQDVTFKLAAPDKRPPIMFDDAQGVKLNNFKADGFNGEPAWLRQHTQTSENPKSDSQ